MGLACSRSVQWQQIAWRRRGGQSVVGGFARRMRVCETGGSRSDSFWAKVFCVVLKVSCYRTNYCTIVLVLSGQGEAPMMMVDDEMRGPRSRLGGRAIVWATHMQ